MTANLKISVPKSEKNMTFDINNVNFKNSVEELKTEVCKKVNFGLDKYELIYCGCVLKNESSLESCGLKSGVTVHCVTKKESVIPIEQCQVSEVSAESLSSTLRSLNHNRSLRIVFQNFINKEDFNENLIAAIPSLKSDLVSLAIVNDPVLMEQFINKDIMKRTRQSHPALVEAIQYITASIQMELEKNPTSYANPIAGSSSMMDHDMEDTDSSPSEPTTPQAVSNSSSNASILTMDYLAQALANARSNAAPAALSTNRTPLITSEMFSQAVQQAFESTNSSGVPASPVTPVLPSVPTLFPNLQNQLAVMHEMGLMDDMMNMQALNITGGNIQAAIEYLLNNLSEN